MCVVARSSRTTSRHSKPPSETISSTRRASSRASAARHGVAPRMACPNGSSVPTASSQRFLLRSVTSSSTHGSKAGASTRAPGASRSGSKSSQVRSKARSIASSTSPRIGVLELINQHVHEALGVLLAQPGVGGQEVASDQLEVLEVEPRAPALALLVALAVEVEEDAEHRVVEVLAPRRAEGRVRRHGIAVLVAGL